MERWLPNKQAVGEYVGSYLEEADMNWDSAGMILIGQSRATARSFQKMGNKRSYSLVPVS